jgi:hypothetical protein
VRTQGDLPRRGAHTAVVYKNSLFIYGGRDGDKDYDDLWELKLCTEPPFPSRPPMSVCVRVCVCGTLTGRDGTQTWVAQTGKRWC